MLLVAGNDEGCWSTGARVRLLVISMARLCWTARLHYAARLRYNAVELKIDYIVDVIRILNTEFVIGDNNGEWLIEIINEELNLKLYCYWV